MAQRLTTAEQLLVRDLEQRRERFGDEKFATELYQALTNRDWFKEDHEVALSRRRAEAAINDIRQLLGAPPLPLEGSGEEGAVSRAVAEELGALGWNSEPVDTSRDDPAQSSEGTD